MTDKPGDRAAAILMAAAMAAPLTLISEGLVTKTYADPVGIPTVCFGHTGVDVKPGQTFTREQCEVLAVMDLAKHGAEADKCLTRPVPIEVRAAFTDFTFNGGGGLFCKSSMARKANAGDLGGACAALSLYVYAKGRPLPGLVKRRKAERELCERGLS